MRAWQAQSILDCADMAARRRSTARKAAGVLSQPRGISQRDDTNWFCHSIMTKGADGKPRLTKKPIAPYVVEIEEHERDAYYRQRIHLSEAAE